MTPVIASELRAKPGAPPGAKAKADEGLPAGD